MNPLVVSFGTVDPAIVTRTMRVTWDDFAHWLAEVPPEVTGKDTRGWYCPVEFDPAYRNTDNFVARYAITFDFDVVGIDAWGEVIEAWSSTAFVIYTTFSHRADRPRFRVVMPLSRPTGFDEFQAVARKVAADVGIERVARESFTPCQMMYSPARSLGGAFESYINRGEMLDVDAVLAEYEDWTNASSWPRRVDHDRPSEKDAERVDPRDKPGIIGLFNRTFTISQAIEKFGLPYARVR